MGHVHLHVADIDRSMHFYSGVLGYRKFVLWKPMRMGDVTLGSYLPHRFAFNTSAGEGAPPPPKGTSGLRHYTVVLPNTSALDAVVERFKRERVEITDDSKGVFVRDPSQNLALITVGRHKA
jgi:catechol 2,3-dioxygenase